MAETKQAKVSALGSSKSHYEWGGRKPTRLNLMNDFEKGVIPTGMDIGISTKVSITCNLDQEGGIVNGLRGFAKPAYRNIASADEETDSLIPVTKVKQKLLVTKTHRSYYIVIFPLMS